ncbi:MAG: tRNA (N6-threonylcarbamoyladenosine(37)-N6)-methyltransferase TrmO [Candidatus Lokiarchaeota archaeon]|nr:tRNA (N6-threonylcarbamoyladenosine(37)-N6)-methyltransferase TrmO [Candidatus Lokiarchaeota archaeon]MBD3337523.1 tRNA (N6-threonylcarbamoyladenosine(37)-N6)-methyltransferase TrmO [Candidatus Lokiarchaeota archaeon]
MKNIQEDFRLKSIGHVRIEGDTPDKMKFYIDIKEKYRSALKQLGNFSHVISLFWFHENDREEIRNQKNWTTVPPYGENTPETGIFATRSECRPNLIGLTTSKIISVDEKKGIVQIEGTDAIEGTPVLDLKAYFPISDRIRDCRIAPWLQGWPEWQEEGYEWWVKQGFFDEYEG